jgi:threonylcarbamoyladenosine tRNA methylthiotransferase MtaB
MEVKERCRVMRMIGKQKKSDFYRKFIGKPLEIIIEDRKHLPEGYLVGTSANYIPVLIEKSKDPGRGSVPFRVVVERVTKDLMAYGRPA